MKDKQKALLLLEDGTLLEGRAMGALGRTMGTVVFNTSMTGYQEALTCPVNRGLLLVQTFPMAGNYGINDLGWESDQVQAAGYIAREICDQPSNYLCKGTLEDFLVQHKVVGICGIDTRHLTKHIREKGEQRGMIVSGENADTDALLEELRAFQPAPSRWELAAGSAAGIGRSAPDVRLAAADFGLTNSQIRLLADRGAELTLFGWDRLSQIAEGGFDGILLSDGPGGPEDYADCLDSIRRLCALGIPVLGVGLGHLLLAAANGMQVTRLSCGHRGASQPVLDRFTGRTYITCQNHAWTVAAETVEEARWSLRFVNANDKTCEGLCSAGGRISSVQFLPDAQTRTHTTGFVYDAFFQAMRDAKQEGGN